MLPLLSMIRPMRDRNVFALEDFDRSAATPFSVHREGVLRQVGDQVAALIDHGGVADHQAGVGAENGARSSCCASTHGRRPRPRLHAPAIRRRLLLRRIVALFPEWPQQGHAVRLHQFDLHLAVFAVARDDSSASSRECTGCAIRSRSWRPRPAVRSDSPPGTDARRSAPRFRSAAPARTSPRGCGRAPAADS